MANVTKIKAKDPSKPQKPSTEKAPEKEVKKVEKEKEAEKVAKNTKKDKKVFILFRPFCAFGRYLRDSWKEIRQVRWPNRKVTWKMVLAVLVYSAFFIVLITLLDLLFEFLFNLILS